jgi:hypothetical protein
VLGAPPAAADAVVLLVVALLALLALLELPQPAMSPPTASTATVTMTFNLAVLSWIDAAHPPPNS